MWSMNSICAEYWSDAEMCDVLLLEAAGGELEPAQQRIEDLVCLHVAVFAALSHLPVHEIHGTAGKKKVKFKVHQISLNIYICYLTNINFLKSL